MSTINLINHEDIISYLNNQAGYSENAEYIGRLLCIALEKPLRRDIRTIQIAEYFPENPPEWMAKKMGVTIFHEFVPSSDLNHKIAHIKDWIVASIVRNAHWLHHVDEQNRPYKLLKIGSVDQAYQEAEKDRIRQRQKNQNIIVKDDAVFENQVRSNDISIIHDFDDGSRLVRILSERALVHEGFFMSHCIGDGAYHQYVGYAALNKGNVIYSLRDPQNKPHITMHIDLKEKKLLECRGKFNAVPSSKYVPKIIEMVQNHKLAVIDATCCPGYVFTAEGDAYSLGDLPHNIVIRQDVDIDGHDDFMCPDNLVIEGNLTINKSQRDMLKPCLRIEGKIYESTHIDDEHYMVTVYKRNLQTLYAKQWGKVFNDADMPYGFHREDGPAEIDYDVRTGRIISKKWFLNGKLHREDGPAIERWNPMNGEKTQERWYINDERQKTDAHTS